jgi:hypothetical protein
MCVSFHGQEQLLRLGSQHRLDQPAPVVTTFRSKMEQLRDSVAGKKIKQTLAS